MFFRDCAVQFPKDNLKSLASALLTGHQTTNGTQMTLVLNGKGLLLEGSNPGI